MAITLRRPLGADQNEQVKVERIEDLPASGSTPAGRSYVVRVTGNPSGVEDEEIPGRYAVTVRGDLEEAHHITAVLDCFHQHIGIASLDDFDVAVLDEHGNSCAEPDEPSQDGLSHAAEFEGRVGPADEGEAPWTPASSPTP